MRNWSCFTMLILIAFNVLGQQSKDVKLSIVVALQGKSISIGDQIYKVNKDTQVKFKSLRFYITNIQLFQNNLLVYTEENSNHLVDIEDPATQDIFLDHSKGIAYDKLEFNFGVDSTTNVSGALGGDLDPTKGMYWTWRSGYVNFKMEGNCISCSISKNNFGFHIGGYQYPNAAVQKIELQIKGKRDLKLELNLNNFFDSIDLENQKGIMSPSAEAVVLSKLLASSFSIK